MKGIAPGKVDRKFFMQVVDAFTDVMDGYDASDLQGATGLSQERCEEIVELSNKLMVMYYSK